MTTLPLADHGHSITPLERLRQLFKADRRDIVALLLYTLLNGSLMLAVPLTAQALVNTIAAGVFYQPLIVLTGLLLAGLLLFGLFRLLQLTLVEVIQQRIFARVTLQLAHQLPQTTQETLHKLPPGPPVNRFFDVLTIQKTWSKLLLDGPSAVFQIIIGLIVLAFYSPFLVGFDLILVTTILIVIWGLSWNGLRTSMEESYHKYAIAGLLQASVSIENTSPIPLSPEIDESLTHYLDARGRHFRVYYRHTAGMYLAYALASAGILSIGGWLVISRQMSLGQLVASELVVVSILSAFEKLVLLLDPFYDLMTALDKLGHLLELPTKIHFEASHKAPHQKGGAS